MSHIVIFWRDKICFPEILFVCRFGCVLFFGYQFTGYFLNKKMQNSKHKLLKALFAEAKKLGIGQETLREDITPGVINKRLSAASPQEIAKVLIHIHNRHGIPETGNTKFETLNSKQKQYESSRAGLLEEIRDLAIVRFGEDYALPLNAFCARFGETDGFRRMRINQMKRVKQRLKELQREDPRVATHPNPSQEGTKSEKVITFLKGRKGFFGQL